MASKTTHELQVKLGASESPSWKKTFNKAEKAFSKLDSMANKVAAGIAVGATATAAAAAYAVSNAVGIYTEFEQEMATVQSISGASAQQFLDMKDAAMEAGRSTVFTATESASALEYMSLAGWSVEESIAGLTPILHMAAATGKELQTTSDLVTDSMSALGLGVDELDAYLDKLITSNNAANTSAEEMMEALIKTGGASRTLGASLDDTITSLAILANNGTKAEEAGRALNAIFVRLAGNTSAMKELDNLGVRIWEDDGSFIGLEESLIRINDALSNLTDEQRALSLKNVAGTNYYSQMSYLLDAVSGKQVDENGNAIVAWQELETQVADSSGALGRMYDITTDTLLNAQKKLQSAKEDMQIQLVNVFSEDAKEFVSCLAEELPNVTDSLVDFAEAHKGEFAELLEGLGEGIEVMWENGVALGSWVIKHRGAIVGALAGIGTGIAATKVIMLGFKIAEIFTNPLYAAVAVAGLAATAIGAVAGEIRTANIEAVNSNLADHFGDIALSLKDIEGVANYIVSSECLTGVVNALEAFDDLDSFSGKMENAVKSLEKMNWKISIGMELTEGEQEEYKRAIDDYVSNAQEYALQAEYAVSLNLAVAFDENDLESNNVVNKVNAFYANKYQELSDLGKQLGDAVTDAFNDGLLDIEEVDAIAKLQAQMADIEKQLAVGDFDASLSLMGMDFSGTKLNADSIQRLLGEIDEKADAAVEKFRESYAKNYSAITAAYESGESGMTEAEYKQAIQKLQEQLANDEAGIRMKGMQFLINTVNEGYESEIGDFQQAVREALEYYNDDDYKIDWEERQEILRNAIIDEIRGNGPDKVSKQAVSELLEAMGTDEIYALQDEWDSLSSENQALLQSMIDDLDTLRGMTNYNKFNGAAGDIDGLYRYVANELENSDKYANIKWDARYSEEPMQIQQAIEGTYAYSQEYLDEVYSQGLSTTTQFDLTLTPSFSMMGSRMGSLSDTGNSILSRYSLSGNNVMHNAAGGIYDKPILTTFAEEGPEAAVPLDGSERAKSLWTRAGQILGMLPQGNRDHSLLAGVSGLENHVTGGNIQISYNPQVTIQGDASKEEVHRGLSLTLDDLREMIAEIQREDSRVAFR